MRKDYDAVIIGAGPAGLNAGLRLTSIGVPLRVLLIDKTVPWERSIPCAEGVGRRGLEEALEVDPSWIRLVISRAVFNAPNGISVSYTDPHKGFIINRAKMQMDLAAKLEKRGVEIALCVRAQNISPPNGLCAREIALDNGETVSARVVIDASGPTSLLGRGEKINWKPYDLEPACFVIAENVDPEEDAVRIYVGQDIAPGGGYAWMFPRGGGAANIGIVLGRNFVKGANLKTKLDQFVNSRFPKAKIITTFAGSISCGYRRGPVALPGLIKCGDAANAVNPISRAGIAEALMSGGLAGGAAFDMLGAQTEKRFAKICKEYEKQWFEKRGARHQKLAKVKDSLAKVPDEDYNRAAKTLQTIPSDALSMAKIFGASLGRFPRLVWALRHLM